MMCAFLPLPTKGLHTRIPRRLICQRATVFRRLPLYANGTPEAVRRPPCTPLPITATAIRLYRPTHCGLVHVYNIMAHTRSKYVDIHYCIMHTDKRALMLYGYILKNIHRKHHYGFGKTARYVPIMYNYRI